MQVHVFGGMKDFSNCLNYYWACVNAFRREGGREGGGGREEEEEREEEGKKVKVRKERKRTRELEID